MFPYKICSECRILFKQFLFVVVLCILIIYLHSIDNEKTLLYVMLSIGNIPVLIFSYLHYKEHQKKEFNKILKKFGIK